MQNILEKQRRFFMSGATRPLAFRRDALERLQQAMREREKQLADALHADLGKSAAESYMCEIGLCLSSVREAINHLRRWAAPKRVSVPLAQFPASARIIPEPYGVALIISPWNYPMLLSIDPLISALAAGNCCVLRFSCNAPHTAAALTELLSDVFPQDHADTLRHRGRRRHGYGSAAPRASLRYHVLHRQSECGKAGDAGCRSQSRACHS